MELHFSECKTMMGLQCYERDVAKCGGRITCKELNTIKGTGIVTFEVDDIEKFKKEFRKTDVYEFLNQEL